MKSTFAAVLALAALAAAAPARRQCSASTATPTATPTPTETTSTPQTDPTTPPVSGGGGGSVSGPIFSVYADEGIDANAWPSSADLGDWNDLILSFWLSDGRGGFDTSAVWAGLNDTQKDAILADYHGAGKQLRVAIFGATDLPLKHGGDPVAIAGQVAQFVKDNKLDGVDVDYEDSESFNAAGDGETFIINLQKELRNQLPSPYIISHAPQSPYFTNNGMYPQGAYVKVHSEVGSTIDFYNVQYYNQGPGMYEDCDSLFNGGGSTIAGTSVNEMIKGGIPADKIVVGKPGSSTDASNGYIAPAALGDCVKQNADKPRGVMSWQWKNAKADWIAAARGDL
ncbi:glycoside hydrolase [Auriculariales sp. MPI-PUGE-AT-0066]|nr:glycoside hydrolase [Auriculariales sp. MPI-PUGE-AT-0066]